MLIYKKESYLNGKCSVETTTVAIKRAEAPLLPMHYGTLHFIITGNLDYWKFCKHNPRDVVAISGEASPLQGRNDHQNWGGMYLVLSGFIRLIINFGGGLWNSSASFWSQ